MIDDKWRVADFKELETSILLEIKDYVREVLKERGYD